MPQPLCYQELGAGGPGSPLDAHLSSNPVSEHSLRASTLVLAVLQNSIERDRLVVSQAARFHLYSFLLVASSDVQRSLIVTTQGIVVREQRLIP